MKQVKADDINQYLVYDMAMLASQVSVPLAKWQRLIFVINHFHTRRFGAFFILNLQRSVYEDPGG